MSYTLVTHSGKAHIDEVLACAVLAVHKGTLPAELRRIDSGEAADLAATGRMPGDWWLVDCGLVFDPERRLFDHHQDGNLPSAALMLFNRFFPELAGTELHTYFELVSRVDTGGARSLTDHELVGESRDYWGFVHQLLVRMFESEPMAVLDIVMKGLIEKIRFEETKKAASEWVSFPGRLDTEEVDGHAVLVYREQPPIEVFDGLRGIDRPIIRKNNAVAVYGYDRKDPSIRTLYRTEIGHDLLDFSRTGARFPLFSHQGGFLLRFRPADSEEWRRIVSASILR